MNVVLTAPNPTSSTPSRVLAGAISLGPFTAGNYIMAMFVCLAAAYRPMSLFRLKKSGGPRELEVSMAGLKLGSTVLQLDGGDGELIAALAGAVGISGEACAVVENADQADRFERAAAKVGVLVEVKTAALGALPFDPETFDVVVAKDVIGEMRMNDRVVCLQQALRVLRLGGRCLIIEQAVRGGLGVLLSRRTLDAQYLANRGAQGALKAEGFHGVRLLAEGDGQSFVEGTK